MKIYLLVKLSLLISIPFVCFARNNDNLQESDIEPHLLISNEQLNENVNLEQDIENFEQRIEQLGNEIEEMQHELQNAEEGSDRAWQLTEELIFLNVELEENSAHLFLWQQVRLLREINETARQNSSQYQFDLNSLDR